MNWKIILHLLLTCCLAYSSLQASTTSVSDVNSPSAPTLANQTKSLQVPSNNKPNSFKGPTVENNLASELKEQNKNTILQVANNKVQPAVDSLKIKKIDQKVNPSNQDQSKKRDPSNLLEVSKIDKSNAKPQASNQEILQKLQEVTGNTLEKLKDNFNISKDTSKKQSKAQEENGKEVIVIDLKEEKKHQKKSQKQRLIDKEKDKTEIKAVQKSKGPLPVQKEEHKQITAQQQSDQSSQNDKSKIEKTATKKVNTSSQIKIIPLQDVQKQDKNKQSNDKVLLDKIYRQYQQQMGLQQKKDVSITTQNEKPMAESDPKQSLIVQRKETAEQANRKKNESNASSKQDQVKKEKEITIISLTNPDDSQTEQRQREILIKSEGKDNQNKQKVTTKEDKQNIQTSKQVKKQQQKPVAPQVSKIVEVEPIKSTIKDKEIPLKSKQQKDIEVQSDIYQIRLPIDPIPKVDLSVRESKEDIQKLLNDVKKQITEQSKISIIKHLESQIREKQKSIRQNAKEKQLTTNQPLENENIDEETGLGQDIMDTRTIIVLIILTFIISIPIVNEIRIKERVVSKEEISLEPTPQPANMEVSEQMHSDYNQIDNYGLQIECQQPKKTQQDLNLLQY